jgi:glycosyltransferase involved in cell wall biosynthesis
VPYNSKWANSKIKNFFSARKVKEYLAAGKPVIMPDVIGREDFLEPNKNVLLYQPGNTNDMADKIKAVLSNRDLYDNISKSNLELSKQFSWERIVERSGLLDVIGGTEKD